MEKKTIEIYKKRFDDIRHEENGVEFWYARELMELLEYVQWRNFEKTIEKAKISCENNGITASDHFADVSKMVEIGSKAQRKLDDYLLTRYACYLIAENGDPRKEQIAFAQKHRNDRLLHKISEQYVFSVYEHLTKSQVVYRKELRRKLRAALKLGRECGSFPTIRGNVWLYSAAYPCKPFWWVFAKLQK